MSSVHDRQAPGDAGPNTLAAARKRPADAQDRSVAKGDVPAAVLDRYLIERDRQGRPERFFRDHRATEPAFRDTGRSLATAHAYPDIVSDMLKVAQHRGWSRITVRGEEAFRRDVWIQGQALGLEVVGYRPRARDRQAAGDPAPPRSGPARETRLHMASTVVRSLIADPEAQRRLLAYAAARFGLARNSDLTEAARAMRRERDR